MKKCIVYLLIVALLVGVTACDRSPAESNDVSNETSSTANISTTTSDNVDDTSNVSTTGTVNTSSEETTHTTAPSTVKKTEGQLTATKTTSKVEVKYNMKLSDYILDESVHTPRYLNASFEAYTDYGRNGSNEYMSSALVKKTIEKAGLGSVYYAAFDGKHSVAGEWVYTFLNLNGMTDGSGLPIKDAGWISNPPKSDRPLKLKKTSKLISRKGE